MVDNRALEELHERLLRWDELCAQLRELYYRYLDLAAFRSEKCYFPGRKCRRSWNRQYDVGDLTLMWTYILNTAPLCGKLIRALAEVEYKIRKRALESLEKYGGTETISTPNEKVVVKQIVLKVPVNVYLVLLDDKLYAIWGEFNDLSKKDKKRTTEIERRVLAVIEHYRRNIRTQLEVEEYEVDKEYERLWLEVPLPESASKLLGGKSKAPVALFRNLGWLLSDDARASPIHSAGNFGQVAVRIFDWIAMATYVKRISPRGLLAFRITVDRIAKTKDGYNPHVEARPIDMAAKIIRTVYKQIKIPLSEKTEEVLARGYAVLAALREGAFKREGLTYVVDNVGAWIAFSATVSTIVLGDGYIVPFMIGVAAKRVEDLKKAIGGYISGDAVVLRGWQMRLFLPAPATPIFEKTVRLYNMFANYPVAALIEINGATYLLHTDHYRQFVVEKKDVAAELYNIIAQFGLKPRMKKGALVIGYTQLKELAKLVPVRLLNEVEKEFFREVRQAPSFDLETLRNVLEEVAKMAKFTTSRSGKYVRIRVVPYVKSRAWEIAKMFEAAGIKTHVDPSTGRITICSRNSVEAIRKILQQIFSSSATALYTHSLAPFTLSFVKAAPVLLPDESPLSKTAATQRFTKLSSPSKPI